MATGVKPPLYTREILRLAASLPEYVELDDRTGRVEARSPTCGSRIRLDIRVEDGAVAAVLPKVEACAFGQASTALMLKMAPGRNFAAAEALRAQVQEWLAGKSATPPYGLEALEPVATRSGRHGAVLLPFRALEAALEEAGA